jgi:hypothetical protein
MKRLVIGAVTVGLLFAGASPAFARGSHSGSHSHGTRASNNISNPANHAHRGNGQ